MFEFEFKRFVIRPFAPNNNTSPKPCEIDGISIGRTRIAHTADLNLMPVLYTQQDNIKPISKEMKVAKLLMEIELVNALLNIGDFNKDLSSSKFKS